jgi:uncharacterized protein YqgV (UPF0045/DUF77 family)
MEITVEISYYPLLDKYREPVEMFINELNNNPKITIEPGTMSSLITGQYDDVMNLLQQKLKPFLENFPSVFTIKISNSCKPCK